MPGAPKTPHALLSGGGTGGHVFPALAVGFELRKRGWTVSLAGRPGGLEERLTTAAGIPFHPVASAPMIGTNAWERARALVTIGRSAIRCRSLVRGLGSRVVVGTGGYASAPGVAGAHLAGCPILLLEPNARAGSANRWLSKWAAEAVLAFDQAAQDFRCPTRITGVPVREEFFEVPRDLPANPPRLLVLGGSQGARQINELVPGALAAIAARHPDLEVCHQAGAQNVAAVREAYEDPRLEHLAIEVTPFLDDVAGAMANAHLVISRAGAVTLAEICAAGRPSILVPLALAGGHQRQNADALARVGAALVARDGIGQDELAVELDELLRNRRRLVEMGGAARELAWPDAAEAIADRIEALGGVG